jgi:predicted dehydrogenase
MINAENGTPDQKRSERARLLPGRRQNRTRKEATARHPGDRERGARLRVALLGLSGIGADYLAAIRANDAFQLVALGDPDPQVRRSSGQSDGVRTYEDMRSLIVECAGDGLDLIFVTLEPFQSREFVELAGQRGIGVFHKPPFARTVVEARALLSVFGEHGPPFVVPRFWHYEDAFASLTEAESHIGPVRAVAASVATQDLPIAWRGDSLRSGGGVLLNGAYEWLDLIVNLLGVPESVHGECTAHASSGSTKTYDTEDFAHATLRFRGDRIGSLMARRGAVEPSRQLSLFGPKGEMYANFNFEPSLCTETNNKSSTSECGSGLQLVSSQSFPGQPQVQTVSANGGGIVILRREHTDDRAVDPPSTGFVAGWIDTTAVTAAAINAFGAARRGESRRLPAPAKDHLNTLAVIEAAYLSAKTGAPESPRQFLGD